MSVLTRVAARLVGAVDRLLSSLLMAAAVTLLAAGLLWYGSPAATGAVEVYAGTGALGDPGDLPRAGSSALPDVATNPPTTTPQQTPGPSSSTGPGRTPGPTPAPVAVATRVVIPSLEIDLPIISRDLKVAGQGPNQYPPCDVALYHTAFGQPGEPGTVYLYGHAREGMFLPLLTESQRHDGASLIGSLAVVYTDDDKRYVYEIVKVKRHAVDFSIADNPPTEESQLVLQTSEGPRGTVPKLQVLAELRDVLPADDKAAHPKAKPRPCYDTP